MTYASILTKNCAHSELRKPFFCDARFISAWLSGSKNLDTLLANFNSRCTIFGSEQSKATAMDQKSIKTPKSDIATFRRLRKAIGWMGISLPFALVFLSLVPFFETDIQQSISHYYYTNLREVFTGVLCAVSLFLIRYQGVDNPKFWKNDDKMTNLAGVMALGVALIPTSPGDCGEKIYTLIPVCAKVIGWFHYAFAAAFFLILAIISIVIFTIGQKENPEIEVRLLNENNIYKTCGWAIILFVLLIPICGILELFNYSTLILEALALIAFGTSWLIKGRVLGDKGALGKVLYREVNE